MASTSHTVTAGDAAALFLAVLTLASTNINEKGLWEPEDTAIGLVVGVAVVAFTADILGSTRRIQRIATELIYACALTVAAAWPLQYLVRMAWTPSGTDQDSINDASADMTTLVAAIVAVFVTRVAVRRYTKRQTDGGRSTPTVEGLPLT